MLNYNNKKYTEYSTDVFEQYIRSPHFWGDVSQLYTMKDYLEIDEMCSNLSRSYGGIPQCPWIINLYLRHYYANSLK